MDVKFYKKLIWIGERSIRNHPKDRELINFITAQNARTAKELKEFLAKNPGKNEKFDPKTDIVNYAVLEGKSKVSPKVKPVRKKK